ncbi:MAG: lipopolysaccharide biosynthesis protein [Ruminococcus sp.]|nr:lipopolysaccharide biosynthesis protein [Ruminococcus sp.]
MAKKDDRNLNITIKNQEDKENEVVVSIPTVLKKLRKYVFVWVVVAVLFVVFAFGYATVTTHVSKPSLMALISFSFDGVEKGLDPNGDSFEVTSVKSPAVIEAALTDLNMDLENLEPIRAGIKFQGIKPKDAVDRITLYEKVVDANGNVNAVDKILETSYFPTQYKVYFDYNNMKLSDEQAVDVFNAVLEQYQDYFYQRYGYNESLGNAVTSINYEDYDYTEAVDVFKNSLQTLEKYVKDISNDENKRFRSSATGYTFGDLYEAVRTVESIDLDKISSYVTVNNLTKDKDEALAYYEYRIKALNRSKAQYEEQLAAYQTSIESYEKDQIFIFGNGTDDTNTQSTVASEQYDKMVQAKNDIASTLAQTKQQIEYYKERQESLKNNPVGSTAKTEKVEESLAALNKKIETLVDLVNRTSDDYYRNVTFKNAYSVLVPATNTATDKLSHIIDNAKTPLVILEALAFVIFFAVAFIDALITDNKKKKVVTSDGIDEISSDEEDEDVTPEEAVEIIADEAEKVEEKKENSNNGKNNKKKK